MSKKFNFNHPKKTKWFFTFIVIGVLLIIASIFLAPIWNKCGDWCFWKNWGNKVLNLIICAMLLLYLFGFLLKKIIHGGNGITKILTIVEFVLLLLVAIGCVLSQFKVINVSGACKIFGLALWCRGIVECIRGYYFRHDSESKQKYPLWYFCIALAMVTFGTYIFAKPFISDLVILWLFVGIIFVSALLFIYYGIVTKPKSTKSSK